MNPRSEMVLKAFLSRHPDQERLALERFLSEPERLRLAELPSFESEAVPEHFSQDGSLEEVHWSWFLPTLKSFSTREQRLFLSALTPLAAENLRGILHIEKGDEDLSEMGRAFLRQQLLHSLVGAEEGHLPPQFLPPSPLNALLGLSKKELTRLIDFLSLYDLAAELRQIVETKILKKLYSFLSEEQRVALKAISTKKEPQGFPRLSLDRWDGDEESFRHLLHRKGLARLGVGLSGQDPDLIWTICHRLDIGRGNTLFKLCAKSPVPPLTDAVVRQIEEWLGQ